MSRIWSGCKRQFCWKYCSAEESFVINELTLFLCDYFMKLCQVYVSNLWESCPCILLWCKHAPCLCRRWVCSAVLWPLGSSALSWTSLVCLLKQWTQLIKEVRCVTSINIQFLFIRTSRKRCIGIFVITISWSVPTSTICFVLVFRCGGICQGHGGQW